MELHNPLAVVTPTVDGPVLAVLALVDAKFTVSQLTRMLPYSDEGIRAVLKRLSTQGVVRPTRVANTITYSFNHDHVAATAIRQLASLRATLLERLEVSLAGWGEPAVYAALFGSAARNDMSVGSDIDLFVVRSSEQPSELWQAQVASLVDEATRWTGNEVRPLDLSERQVVAGDAVLEDIAAHGLTLAGSHAWLRRRTKPGPSR